MKLREEIYKIQETNITQEEKNAYIHFVGNAFHIITFLWEESYKDYKEELEKLVKKIYNAYLEDKTFRMVLTDLAQRTNYGASSKYLCQLSSKYYDNYFKKLEEISSKIERSLDNLFKTHN